MTKLHCRAHRWYVFYEKYHQKMDNKNLCIFGQGCIVVGKQNL